MGKPRKALTVEQREAKRERDKLYRQRKKASGDVGYLEKKRRIDRESKKKKLSEQSSREKRARKKSHTEYMKIWRERNKAEVSSYEIIDLDAAENINQMRSKAAKMREHKKRITTVKTLKCDVEYWRRRSDKYRKRWQRSVRRAASVQSSPSKDVS